MSTPTSSTPLTSLTNTTDAMSSSTASLGRGHSDPTWGETSGLRAAPVSQCLGPSGLRTADLALAQSSSGMTDQSSDPQTPSVQIQVRRRRTSSRGGLWDASGSSRDGSAEPSERTYGPANPTNGTKSPRPFRKGGSAVTRQGGITVYPWWGPPRAGRRLSASSRPTFHFGGTPQGANDNGSGLASGNERTRRGSDAT